MKKSKILLLAMASVVAFSTVLSGCNTSSGDSSKGSDSSSSSTGDSAASNKDPMTLEVYSAAANYQGIQGGWFAKVVKDKFNIELNIIAPNASGDGDALYQTRTSSGYLGDIVVLDNPDLQDCIKAGLIMDITDDVQSAENLKQYYDQYKVFNSTLEGNEEGKIYGMPCQITNTSPTAYSEREVYSSPMFPWDYYTELGTPEMKNLDDLLNTMEQMQKAHSVNEKGDPAYALSLWADWDNPTVNEGIEIVNQLTKWYGYEVQGSILLGNKGDMKEVTDDDGAYYKMLKFFYEANQRGLVDPDSGTQDWETACTKMKNKQVLLFWYSWQRGFWNTIDRGNSKSYYIYAPVADMDFYQPADFYYGDERAFALGSGLDESKKARTLEFMDWMTSPEGLDCLHVGIEGWSYNVNDDGTYTITEDGQYALMENREVPAEFGGGGYNDGLCKINQWPLHAISTNPLTGEPYNKDYWSTYLEANKTTTTNEWAEKYSAEYQVEYLYKTKQLNPVPKINMILPSDSTDIALIRGQCGNLLNDTSWKMVFAASEDEFNQLWSDMKTTLEGLSWKDLVKFDKEKYQKIVDARAEAIAKAK